MNQNGTTTFYGLKLVVQVRGENIWASSKDSFLQQFVWGFKEQTPTGKPHKKNPMNQSGFEVAFSTRLPQQSFQPKNEGATKTH